VANTFGYAAGTAAATVDVPVTARLKRVRVTAAGTAATITIAGGATITVPASGTFNEPIDGDVALGADVVIGGTPAAWFVAWMT
jgi:hypothetical protein